MGRFTFILMISIVRVLTAEPMVCPRCKCRCRVCPGRDSGCLRCVQAHDGVLLQPIATLLVMMRCHRKAACLRQHRAANLSTIQLSSYQNLFKFSTCFRCSLQK